MNVDVLAFGPHPDDVELFCGGTVARLVTQGYRVAFVDMTAGELGTRGSREEREREAENAAAILGIHHRENLRLPDGGLNARDDGHRGKVIDAIRRLAPQLVIAPAARDRHPDHMQGMQLVNEAVFLANVGGYPSELPRHKVKAVMQYPMWWHPEADIIVDVSDTWNQRMDAVRAYRTQFFTEGVEGPKTFLSAPQFVEWVEGRGSQFGAIIGVPYGEPYLLRTPVPVDDPMKILVHGAGEVNP